MHRLKGEYKQASELIEKAVVICQEHLPARWDVYYSSGLAALEAGDCVLAARRFKELVQHAQKSDNKSGLGMYLDGLAAVAADTHRPELAAKLHGAALTILEVSEDNYFSADARMLERHIHTARGHLGEANFIATVNEGRKLTLEQAIQLALG